MTLWRIRATVEDRPGFLAVLTASLALRAVNILAVQVHTTEAGAVDDFLVDAPDSMTGPDLIAAVERGRGRDCWVGRAEAQGLVDEPTRALGLAGRLVRDPDALGAALRGLLGADTVTWRPTPSRQRPGFDSRAMRLPDPAGGCYDVVRHAPAFTPAEYARAQALVELAATVVRRAAERVTLLLPEGTELAVRPATADDLAGVQEMHARCSAGSRHRRYLGSDQPSPARLGQLIEPADGLALLALSGGSGLDARPQRVVAMANLVAEGAIAEVALLVEDAWQRRGVGAALLRRLVAHALEAGYAALVAHTHADNTAGLRTLDRLSLPHAVDRDGPVLTVTVALAGRPPVAPPTPAAAEA
jgi:GNAT superfamily N-acetyltransferase